MIKIKKGDRVQHAIWGGGEVERTLASGRVRVLFDASPSLPRRLALKELELASNLSHPGRKLNGTVRARTAASSPQASPTPRRKAPTRSKSSSVKSAPTRASDSATPLLVRDRATRPKKFLSGLTQGDAWQTLEALRIGVVPSRGVQEYTLAREAELSSIESMLKQGQGCRVLWGDYGSGKTHLLEAAEQLALDSGFATARLTLDPTENALHHPLRLYRRIADSLRVPDQMSHGFESLFEALMESPQHFEPEGAQASRFFSPYLHILRQGDEESIGCLRDYVRGEKIDADDVSTILSRSGWRGERVLRMSDFRTYGRMYIHLVGTLACWCADAGHRGLVLLFDEVERIDALESAQKYYATEVLMHYAAVTMHPEDLEFDPEDLYKGGHDVHRAIPLRFRESQPLASVFALTPLEEIRYRFEELTCSEAYDINLTAMQVDLLRPLVDRIAGIYERAYPGKPVPANVRGKIRQRLLEVHDDGHDSFRDAVRGSVYMLDESRLGHARNGHL